MQTVGYCQLKKKSINWGQNGESLEFKIANEFLMEYINQTKEELITELQKLQQAFGSLDLLYKKESKDRKEIEFRLHERLKEKKCHNHISVIMSNSAYSFGEVLNKVAEIIPDYLLFPEITGVSIQIDGEIYQTKKFEQSGTHLEKGVKVFGKTIGKVVVCYQKSDLLNPREPFLKEEEDLIFTIADRISNYIERKRTNAALQESELKYRKLIENINDVIYETDDQACITYISPSIEKLVGYTPEELIGRSFLEFVGENIDFLINRFTKLRELSEIAHEYKIVSKSGEDHWIRFSTKAVIEEGVFKGATGTLVDITDRKLVELALQKSEETFRTLIETINDAIYEVNIEGIIRYASPAIEKILGYKVEELTGTNFLDYASPEDRPSLIDILATLEEKDLSNIEYRFVARDGQIRWIRASTSPVFRDGRMIGRTGSLTDINDQKLAEEELRKLSRAVEQSPVSIVITDLDGNIEYANPKATETTGYTLDELKGNNPRVLKSGETSTEDYSLLWKAISSGSQWRGIFHNKKKNGEFYWESSVITPILDQNGEITHYLAVKEDITERRKTEEALQLSELRFRQLAEQSHTVIWEVDSSGLYTYVNAMSETVWGYTPDEMIGKMYFYDLHPEEDRLNYREKVLASFSRKERFNGITNQIVTRNGDLIWILTNGIPILDADGNMIGYRGADNDITAKKQAEDNIKIQNERLNAIIRAIPDLMFVLDDRGIFHEYYATTPEGLLISEEQIIDADIKTLFDKDTAALHLQMINKCILEKSW